MHARELARCTIVVLAMLVVLASDVARSNPDIAFIHVHGPDNQQEIEINVAEISSVRQPRKGASGHFSEGVRCLVYMTNGHFIGTSETCSEIKGLIIVHRKRMPDKK